MLFQYLCSLNKERSRNYCIIKILVIVIISCRLQLFAYTPEEVFGPNTKIVLNKSVDSLYYDNNYKTQSLADNNVSLDVTISSEYTPNEPDNLDDIKKTLQEIKNIINELKIYYKNLYFKHIVRNSDKARLNRLKKRLKYILMQNKESFNKNYYSKNFDSQSQINYIEYTVKPGDCLWNITKRYLGKGSLYPKLVEANKDRYPSLLKNPNLIYPGWKLKIPISSDILITSTTSIKSSSNQNNNNTSITASSSSTNSTQPTTYEKGGKALYKWLQQAGLSGEKLRMAWAIGMAESGGDPRALNDNPATKDYSFGLFQINMIGELGPARRRQFNLKSNEDLFDPMTNIRVMLALSNNCTNWRHWGAYLNGSYKKYYYKFPPM